VEPVVKRRGFAVGTGVAVVCLVAGGWWAASEFVSPAQREAAAHAPDALPIVVAVEKGRLDDTVTARATIKRGTDTAVHVPSGDGATVVTARTLAPGKKAHAGDQVLELNGRPLFVLPGDFVFYRDLGPGDKGPDVEQLQDGLRAAGYSIGSWEDGTYGAGTRTAVAALYRDAGYAQLKRDPDTSTASTGSADAATGDDADDGAADPPPAPPAQVPFVPVSEVVVAKKLPATLSAAPKVGARVDGDTTLTFQTGSLRAVTTVPESVLGQLTSGAHATITADDGKRVTGTLGDVTGLKPDGDGQYTVAIRTGTLPSSWDGQDFLLTITLQAFDKDALLVPARAVASDGSQDTGTVLRRGDSTFESVKVEVLGTVSGTTAVRPVDDGALKEGDRVRVDDATTVTQFESDLDGTGDAPDDTADTDDEGDSGSGDDAPAVTPPASIGEYGG
jgi:hypothetical protein